MEVSLFIPCYVDQLAPSVGLATLELLERLGCRVRYDPEQTCCGQPLLSAGAFPEARRIASRWLERLRGSDAIVCPSASCVATVRRRYAALGIAEDAASRGLCERSYELSEFLALVLRRPDVGASFPHRVALLQSCHGLRELGLGRPSELPGEGSPGPTETVLRAVRGIDVVLPDPPDDCCGFGGVFSVQLPEVSVRMGRARLDALERTGAEYVTATDMSCLWHVEGIRRRAGSGPRAIHVAEILVSTEAR
jgi:L-lactate dehydrogenase complex protein LldE